MSENGHSHFIVPTSVYVKTFITLLVLTVITVVASRIHMGAFNTPIALGIALVKMMTVALFFMGLRWDKGISGVLFFGAGVAVFIFFLLTFADISFRGDISPIEAQTFGIKSPVKAVGSGHGASHGKAEGHH